MPKGRFAATFKLAPKYTTLNQLVRLVLSSSERGPLARRRAGRPRSQVKVVYLGWPKRGHLRPGRAGNFD